MPNSKALAEWLNQEQEQLKRLTTQREHLDAEIAKVKQKEALLKNLLALQSNQPYGVQQSVLPQGRFSKGVSVRDATLTVLREQRRAHLAKIVEVLLAGGLDFNGRSPKRVVFLTLSNLIRSKNGETPVRRDKTDFIYVGKEG